MVKRQLIALAVASLPPLLGLLILTTATAIAAAGANVRGQHDRGGATPARTRPA